MARDMVGPSGALPSASERGVSTMRQIDSQKLRAPAKVIDVEIQETERNRWPTIDVSAYQSVWCLSRRRGIPEAKSFWDVEGDDSIVVADVLRELELTEPPPSPYETLRGVDTSNVDVTVALCTHERPDDLRRALESLRRQSDPDFEILVIDNAPTGRASADVVDESGISRLGYFVEPAKGLSRARNKALAHLTTSFVAWFDDDEEADIDWIKRLKEGLASPARPAAVSGVMLPAELESYPQVLFEQYGGFNKGRGLEPELLSLDSPSVISPLYPLPAFGSGGNMAFRTEALLALGGFDDNLGAGTKTHAGEETRVFSSLIRNGESILHWPPAITWHYHRARMDQLEKQFYGYSSGLTAFYASMVKSDPRVALDIIKLIPHALRDLGLRDGGLKAEGLPDNFPPELLKAGNRGLLTGALNYAVEVYHSRDKWRSRRASRP